MLKIGSKRVFLLAIIALLANNAALGAISGLERVASGLSGPIFVTHAPGDRERLFIVERGGAIKVLNLNTGIVAPTPFLTVANVDAAGEGGLLGLAFHPDYANNGLFYVNVTIDNGGLVFQNEASPFSTHIQQYEVSDANPNIANPTPTPVLDFIQPQSNHNGGWIGFNPAVTPGQPRYLYIPTGDGGGANDRDLDGGVADDDGHTPGIGNAQDTTANLLGKILRIDVDGDDFPGDDNRNYAIPPTNPFKAGVGDPGDDVGDDEIWATGLRNPFRDSFDRLTGDLWLGDVGQGSREEIDRQPASAPGGENFGWRLREGDVQTPGVGGAVPANYRAPVYDYGRPVDPDDPEDQFRGSVVTGGYVYRGPDPSLQGKYFFLDSRSSSETDDDNYWMVDGNPFGTVMNIDTQLTPDEGDAEFPVSFGEDEKGNLYIAFLNSGEVFRIATDQLLPGDYDADGNVDDDDFFAWKRSFGNSGAGLLADGNGSGAIDAADFVVWRNNRGASVHDLADGAALATVPEPLGLANLLPAAMLMFVTIRRRPLEMFHAPKTQ